MGMARKKVWQSIRFPKGLYDCSVMFIEEHPKLGYTNVQEFLRCAVRDKLEIMGGIKLVDKMPLVIKEFGTLLKESKPEYKGRSGVRSPRHANSQGSPDVGFSNRESAGAERRANPKQGGT